MKKRAKAPRKMPKNNKGVRRRKSGRLDFSNTPLAKELKKHNLTMQHGYETQLRIVRNGKPLHYRTR